MAVHLEVAGGIFVNLGAQQEAPAPISFSHPAALSLASRVCSCGSLAGTDNAHVVQANLLASNGVVHIIDHVLTAPAAPSSQNVAQLAFANPRLALLSAAIKRADVVGPLSDEAPLTLLAPTDAAFAKLDPAFLESLMAPENRAQLLQVLAFHVLPGRIAIHDVVTGAAVPTLHNGAKASFASHFGEVTVNGHARVVRGDAAAANGLIHEIDHVLIPSLVADFFQLAQYI